MIQDFNILNRASFEDRELNFKVSVDGGCQQNHEIRLEPEQVFCIIEISWKYEVKDNTNSYGWPKIPVKVSIPDILSDTTSSPHTFSPARFLRQNYTLVLCNSSDINVVVHFTLKGTLVTPKDGAVISDKEILGYSLLDDNYKGMLALGESVVDGLEAKLGVDLRQQKALPGQLPQTSRQLPGQTTKALTDSEYSKEVLISLLIGDLIILQDGLNSKIDTSELRNLASLLVEKGWRRKYE
jgi:hypothetical protein